MASIILHDNLENNIGSIIFKWEFIYEDLKKLTGKHNAIRNFFNNKNIIQSNANLSIMQLQTLIHYCQSVLGGVHHNFDKPLYPDIINKDRKLQKIDLSNDLKNANNLIKDLEKYKKNKDNQRINLNLNLLIHLMIRIYEISVSLSKKHYGGSTKTKKPVKSDNKKKARTVIPKTNTVAKKARIVKKTPVKKTSAKKKTSVKK